MVVIILWQADFSQAFQSLKGFSPKLLLTVCLLQLLTVGLINIQWHKIAAYMGEKTVFRDLLYMNMVGTFVESITPSAKSGGEATKVYLLKTRMGFSTGKAVALVGTQKIISLTAFLLLNVVSIGWFLTTVAREGRQVQIILLSLLFLAGFLGLLLLLIISPAKLQKLVDKIPLKQQWRQRVQQSIMTLEDTAKEMIRQKRKLAYQLILALFIWLLFAFKAYLIAKGLNIHLSFLTIAVVTYLTYMVGMLPLLPGGVGTFEGSMVFFLLPMGIPSHEGIALALILRFVTFWLVFIISAIYIGYEHLRKSIASIKIA